MNKVGTILLILCWVMTVLAAVQPYIDYVLASYLLVFTLFVLPLCIINVLILSLLIFKKSSFIYFHGLFTLINVCLLSKSFVFSIASNYKSNEQTKIHLISSNVDNFLLKNKVLKYTAEVIDNYGPDIVCLQERPHTSLLSHDSISKTFNYGYMAINNREDEVLNLAVFSKWPIVNKKEFYFPGCYNKFIQMDIQCRNNTIRLFNVHLQTTGINSDIDIGIFNQFRKNAILRNIQADKLSNAIKDSPYPVIVCGDFNDTPLSYAYHKISHNLLDCFKESGKGWGGTFQSIGNLFRIDYILCSPKIKVKDYQLIKNPLSDHKIQFGELVFSTL